MHDLATELARLGCEPTVIVPSPELREAFTAESFQGVSVFRVRAPRSKDVNYIRRALAEFLMPLSVITSLKRGPLSSVTWDGVISYSPTIFLGPVVKYLKSRSRCRSYLILRDIFPEWTVDMGLMRRGLAYRLFKVVEAFQYSVADVIGVQSPSNVSYLEKWAAKPGRRCEVLHNWLANAQNTGSTISVRSSALAGRKIFVYAGNMGIAQGMDMVMSLVCSFRSRTDVGFLFVGRGSEVKRFKEYCSQNCLDNVLFYDEVDPAEIPGLYAQCHIGIVALDRRHKTQNVPGKFLSYMQGGLPVLAIVNPGNDLLSLVQKERVGIAVAGPTADETREAADELVLAIKTDPEIGLRCRALAERMFAPERAAEQIVRALAQ